MSTVQIDKGIPMPDRIFKAGWKAKDPKWPWSDLEIGDSFLMNDVKHASVYVMCSIAGKRHGRQFRSAKTSQGMRVWRTA